jgi:hypothetical protein
LKRITTNNLGDYGRGKALKESILTKNKEPLQQAKAKKQEMDNKLVAKDF